MAETERKNEPAADETERKKPSYAAGHTLVEAVMQEQERARLLEARAQANNEVASDLSQRK